MEEFEAWKENIGDWCKNPDISEDELTCRFRNNEDAKEIVEALIETPLSFDFEVVKSEHLTARTKYYIVRIKK